MSSVLESVSSSACRSTFHESRRAPAQPGALRTIAKWLGLATTASAHRAAPSNEGRRPLWDRQGMLEAGNAMLACCRRDDVPLSMAVFRLDDLPQVKSVFGSDVARQFVLKTLGKLNRVASPKGLAIRTGATTFAVLLPGLCHERATAAVHEVLGAPCRIELDASHDGAVLTPAFRVKTAGQDNVSVEEIYQVLRREMSLDRTRNQSSKGNAQPVAMSRQQLEALLAEGEASRSPRTGCAAPDAAIATVPMPLPGPQRDRESALRTRGDDDAAFCQIPATIPMPIGSR
jgi:GGDEF domain-containing protein